jgi:teichuronic acid exporter
LKVINSLKWSAIERFATQGVQFLLMIFLARLLEPEMFGIIGLLAIFLAISQTFVDSGFSSALIRKGKPTEIDYSTAFYFNIFIGLFVYMILYLIAPWISKFFENEQLTLITRVLSLNVLMNSFAVVQRAKLIVVMDFKTQTKASLISIIIGGSTGVYLATNGYGVWALVFQTLTTTVFTVVLLWYFNKWYPKEKFCYKSFKEMFDFGSKLLASALIDTFYNNIYLVLIGKHYTATQLGLFTQAQKLSEFPSVALTGIIQRVNFPLMSQIDCENSLNKSFVNAISLSAFIMFPIMAGIAAMADPIIGLLLGEKWSGVADFLPFLCLAFMVYPIHAINLNLLKVKNRSDLFLKLEIIKKTIITVMLFITVPISVTAICIGLVVTSYISLIVNMFYTQGMTRVTIFEQFKILAPIWFGAIISGLITNIVIINIDILIFKILIGSILGSLLYLVSSKLLFSKPLDQIINIRKNQ